MSNPGPVLAAATASAAPISGLSLHAKVQADIQTLPAGFPAHLPHDLAWSGSDFTNTSEHILVLDDAHHAEIKAALESYKGESSVPGCLLCFQLTSISALGQDGDLVEPASFPLPTLGPKLRELSRDIHNGRGFCVIRGINPANYSVEDLTLAYLGVQSYIAEQRGRQDKRGNMLGKCGNRP